MRSLHRRVRQRRGRRRVRFRGASHALVLIRPRSRGARHSLLNLIRTFPACVFLRPGSLAFNPRPRRLSTPTDAFQIHPDIASYGTVDPQTFCECSKDERVASNACVACAAGEMRVAGDKIPGVDTVCLCDSGYHVASNTCTKCASGSDRASGDDPSGADTSCLGASYARAFHPSVRRFQRSIASTRTFN